MSVLQFLIAGVHITTLLTYLGAGLLVLLIGRKKKLGLQDLTIYTGGVMIVALLSFELTWFTLANSLASSVLTLAAKISAPIYAVTTISVLAVTGLSIHKITGKLHLDRYFAALFMLTLAGWLLWLPVYAHDSLSRTFADPIKLVQTLTVVYLFS